MSVFEIIKLTLSVLEFLGIPALIFLAIKNLRDRKKTTKTKLNSLETGLQAQLRAQMINDYNYWQVKGYAPIYARESFENVYNAYHNLGANGVMDDIHNKFLALPLEKQKKNIHGEH